VEIGVENCHEAIQKAVKSIQSRFELPPVNECIFKYSSATKPTFCLSLKNGQPFCIRDNTNFGDLSGVININMVQKKTLSNEDKSLLDHECADASYFPIIFTFTKQSQTSQIIWAFPNNIFRTSTKRIQVEKSSRLHPRNCA